MSGVFEGNQWTTASGSTWRVVIEPDFVNQVAELCNHLSLSSQEIRSECEKIVEQAQAADGDSSKKEVVKSVIGIAERSGVNAGAQAGDIEGFANLAAALVEQYFGSEKAAQEQEQLLVSLSAAVSKAQGSENAAATSARYSSISSLFNSLPASTSAATRSQILLSLFQLAVSKEDLSILANAVSALPSWISSEWGVLDSSEADKIVASFVSTLESASDKAEAGESIRRLLAAYAGDNTSEELKDKLVLYTLASNTTFDVEALPRSSSAGSVSQLRSVFASGSLSDLAGIRDIPAPLEKEKLQEKLQYILLADFASKNVGKEISYDEIAKVLGLDASSDAEDRALEVESWIIATIRVGLLTARLHQPTNSASIIRASPRAFGAEQWQTLQNRLESWRSSVSSILDVVGRAVGPAPQRQQHTQQAQTHDAQTLTNAAAEQQQAEIEVA